MSRLSKHGDKNVTPAHEQEVVKNFMAGNSYKLTPLTTLRIVAASSIFAEPQYYRDGDKGTAPSAITNRATIEQYSIFATLMKGKTTAADVFTAAIDAALDFDFKGTLDLALELRTDYFMRLNPAVIFVRANLHKDRAAFNEANPGYMRNIGKSIAFRPDDITNQFEYFMYVKGKKNGLSSLMKRTWADRLAEFSRYQLNKYKSKRLIDLVRISHANSEDINELMKTGTLEITETEQTWEIMRSAGKTWREILETIDVPHMALLRNLRGIFTELKDLTAAKEVCEALKAGVLTGKQFPFRYFTAYQALSTPDPKSGPVNHLSLLKDTLEECLDISVANMPKLDGKTICLSDNSGSAWGAVTSEYGSVTVAQIANLSSLITAMQSDEGEVGVFGDGLSIKEVSKRNGLLSQLTETSERGKRQGQSTENGIWMFFDQALRTRAHYDNIFIYSDMQCGTGGLYGVNPREYAKYVHKKGGAYIDVLALVTAYRDQVNPKVNIFMVQVAGYDNSLLPINVYRGAILTGWTGKESLYAKSIIDTWNEAETGKKKTYASSSSKKILTRKSSVNKA